MTEENENASPEMDRAMKKLQQRLKELENKLMEIGNACIEVGASKSERMWYVLKHDGVHHLVDNYAVRAYCGWPIHPDSEIVGPPETYEDFLEIGSHLCQTCAELRRTETKTQKR